MTIKKQPDTKRIVRQAISDDKCQNCQHIVNLNDDIQEGLCADCFRNLPEGEWHTAGTWGRSETTTQIESATADTNTTYKGDTE
jgi:hypothetical protein